MTWREDAYPATSSPGDTVRVREVLDICLQPKHLRHTVRIALVVGVVLTAINQAT